MANYLKYTQLILTKMSFCPMLLNKEYGKCISLLSDGERQQLNRWLSRQNFTSMIRSRSQLDMQ